MEKRTNKSKKINTKKKNTTINKKNTNNKYIIIELILLILIVATILGIKSFTNKTKTIKNDYKKAQLLLKDNNNKTKDLLQKEKEYNDIDNSLTNTRDEFFNTLKQLEDDIINDKTDRKIAYLTFDDGPYFNTYTVLDILDKYDVKATFFTISMNGQYCYDNKGADCFQLYKEYVKRGHTIANHTYTHGIFKGLYDNADNFMDAVIRQEEQIKTQTGGYTPRIVRFPGGSGTATARQKVSNLKEQIINRLRERGYGYVDWTAMDGDGGSITEEQGWEKLKASLDNDLEVVLLHDYSKVTTKLLPEFIEYIKGQGYEMYPLFYESNMIKK